MGPVIVERPTPGIEVELIGERRVRFERDTDPETIRRSVVPLDGALALPLQIVVVEGQQVALVERDLVELEHRFLDVAGAEHDQPLRTADELVAEDIAAQMQPDLAPDPDREHHEPVPTVQLSGPYLRGRLSFGGCIAAGLLANSVPPILALAIAVFFGFLAGCATALIHLKFRINILLAGILMIPMLWSVSLRVMGKSSTPLFAHPNLFDTLWPGLTQALEIQIGTWLVISALVIVALLWFLRTELGLAVRAATLSDKSSPPQSVRWSIVRRSRSGSLPGVHPSDLKSVTGLFVLAALALPFSGRRRPMIELKLRA